MPNLLRIVAGPSLLGLLVLAASAADPAPLPPVSAKQGVTYAADIKPLLDNSCVRCHGAEKAKGGLRLDSLAGALKGSKEGKVIKAGRSAESLLVHAAARLTKEPMPPPGKGQPLTATEVGLLRAWIDQGAK
jgi:hypothetical protein